MAKILITGAAGFIGSHLTEMCIEQGFEVKALVRYNSKNNWGWLERSIYRNDIEIIAGDIRDYDSVSSSVQGCNTVFHLAALIGIPYSYVSPLAYIKTNVEGTYNVLQACLRHSIGSLLVTSTSETYGTAQTVPISEAHPSVGQSPYSATKIGADQLALSYYRSFDLPVKIVRPFNTYGPRQSARAVIPSIAVQLLSGQRELKLGNLSPTRDLTYVKDTVNGFLEIYKSDKLYGEATNIGMNEEISVGELANLISELLSVDCSFVIDESRIRPDKSEVARLRCDNTKIMSTTKWRPKYDLRSGLRETVVFLRENLDLYKHDIYNV